MSGGGLRGPSELQMGNGTLLVTFDSAGEIEQLFAPHIDALQSRLGSFATDVLVKHDSGFALLPLDREHFEIRLRLLPGTQVLQIEYQHRHGPCRILRTLALHPEDALILDSWKVLEGQAGLLHRSVPWMGTSTSAHCSLFHPAFNGLVHHRGRRWLGVLARGEIHWVRVGHLSESDRGRLWSGERVLSPVGMPELQGFPAGPVKLGWDQVVQGGGTWGAMATAPRDKVEFLIICAESERHLGDLWDRHRKIETERFIQMIDGVSTRRHASASALLDRIQNVRVRSIAERSIDVLHALQDARTGALVAAAEVDPHSKVSGGYGYSWPRDGAYLSAALGAFGYRERVESYFHFLEETQDASGAWWQRYLATGHAGPSWGRIQIDEPATVVGAAALHYQRTQDLFWLERIWPTLKRGLDFLESFHGPDHPLGLPSHDLWEERMGIHAYSLGAVSCAFLSGARLASELSLRKEAKHYTEWGEALAKLVTENFVAREGPIRRSFVVNSWDYQKGGGYWDETPDASLLGLITPFGVFNKRDVAAQRILHSCRKSLWSSPVGGVLRYPGDHYRGGNPWILTTLWLGIVDVALGNHAECRESFQWVLSKATSQGMLAEQVHRETGRPCWVIPLGWSHAMFLLFVREVLDRRVERQIWEAL